MKLLILSDLHNDIRPMEVEVDGRRIDENADVIVLAGDIEEGMRSPEWARQAFPHKPVVLVCGNHEFYGRYWNRNLERIRGRSRELGIHFLENDSVEIDGVRFLGCSLWTDFMMRGSSRRQASVNEALTRMTDYKLIKHDRRAGDDREWKIFETEMLHPESTVKRHLASAEWLAKELETCNFHRTVVVTHHAPHPESLMPCDRDKAIAPAYASDLTDLMGRCALWVHGHVHDNSDYEVLGTRVVCNPRGYPDHSGDSLNEDFRPDFLVEV